MPLHPILQRPEIRRFVKFCIVGASSTVIDLGVSYLLHYRFGLPLLVSKTCSFVLSVTNGFTWNRLWTFRDRTHRSHAVQYPIFVSVNIVGLLLNLFITTVIVSIETGTWVDQRPTRPVFVAATLMATLIVVFWNFFANRHWTFAEQD